MALEMAHMHACDAVSCLNSVTNSIRAQIYFANFVKDNKCLV